MKRLNTRTVTTTVDGALDTCRSELESLRDEYQEWYDNLPEAFQQGSKGEELQNAIDQLESAIGRLEVDIDPKFDVSCDVVLIVHRKSKWVSRSMRGDEAVTYARAAMAKLEELRDKIEDSEERNVTLRSVEANDAAEEDMNELENLINEISDGCDEAEGVEWVTR